MAKKESEPKVVLERTYNVPLRKEFQKAPKYKRAKKAGTALRQFLEKHMKSDNIKIGRHLNMKVWAKGIKSPPHHVAIEAKKYEDGSVMVELVGAPVKKVEEKKSKKTVAKEEKKPALKPTEKKVEKEAKKVNTEKPSKQEPDPKNPAENHPEVPEKHLLDKEESTKEVLEKHQKDHADPKKK